MYNTNTDAQMIQQSKRERFKIRYASQGGVPLYFLSLMLQVPEGIPDPRGKTMKVVAKDGMIYIDTDKLHKTVEENCGWEMPEIDATHFGLTAEDWAYIVFADFVSPRSDFWIESKHMSKLSMKVRSSLKLWKKIYGEK